LQAKRTPSPARTRHRIIHSYDSIADDMIWSMVMKCLPVLKVEIRNLLK